MEVCKGSHLQRHMKTQNSAVFAPMFFDINGVALKILNFCLHQECRGSISAGLPLGMLAGD